jgi:hypothetical protein
LKAYLILSILIISIFLIGFQENLVVNAPEGYPNAEIVSIDYPEQVLVNNSFTINMTIDHWTGGDIEGLLACVQDQDEYQDPVPFNAPWPKVRELRRFMPEGPDTDIFELVYQAPNHTDNLSLVVEVYFYHRSTRSITSDRPVSHLEFGDSEIIGVEVVTSIQTPTPTPTTPESTPTTEPTSVPSSTTTPTQPAETTETTTSIATPSDTSSLLGSMGATNALLILSLVIVIIVLVFALRKPSSKIKDTEDKYCSKCRAPIQKGFDFCNKCGKKIKHD